MVKNIVRLIGSEISGLHEAAYLLGAFAFFSQLLALVRDRLLASTFGAGPVLDVYYASFRIPDIIFVSIASLVSVYILIPFLTEKSAQGKKAEKTFISSVFSVFTGGILIVSLVAFFAAPFLSKLLFPGLVDSPLHAELILLTRVLLLQPIFLGISNLFGSITQTRRRFFLYAISPLFYNVGIIGGILFLYPVFGIVGLSIGVVVGAFLHLFIQLPFIISHGYLPRFTLRPLWSDIKRVVLLSLPRTLALSANQIALLVLLGFASVLAVGSITIFNLAFNLQSVPLSIIGVSYSVAAFPTLARLFTNGERQLFINQMVSATRHIIFWSLPAVVLFVVLRAQIVRVILGGGEFDWTETRLVAAALAIFVISLVAQGLTLLFVRGYYAAGNTRTPLIINLVGAVAVVGFAWGFLELFRMAPAFRFFMEALLRVEGIEGTEILMLPLGYSVALFGTATAFWVLFQRDFSSFWSSVSRTVLHSFSAAILMGFVAHRLLNALDNVLDINTFTGIFLQGLLSGVVGIIAGIMLLFFLRNEEVHEISRALHHKFWRAKTVVPEQEV